MYKFVLPPINDLYASINIDGNVVTIPAIIINDIPFPIPLLVIWSPNHNRNAVPAVNIIAILTYSTGSSPAEPINIAVYI